MNHEFFQINLEIKFRCLFKAIIFKSVMDLLLNEWSCMIVTHGSNLSVNEVRQCVDWGLISVTCLACICLMATVVMWVLYSLMFGSCIGMVKTVQIYSFLFFYLFWWQFWHITSDALHPCNFCVQYNIMQITVRHHGTRISDHSYVMFTTNSVDLICTNPSNVGTPPKKKKKKIRKFKLKNK